MGKAKRESKQTTLVIPFILIDPLDALQHLIEQFENKGVIIGGIAASLLGKPRLTVDLDAVILLDIDNLPKLIKLASKQEMRARISHAEAFAR